MRTIICGSRTIANLQFVFSRLNGLDFRDEISEVVSGGCRGVDRLGERWAEKEEISIRRFHADWHFHGKAAGPIRNEQMAMYASCCIAFWDGMSRGTKGMIDLAKIYQLKVVVFECDIKGKVVILKGRALEQKKKSESTISL